MANTAKTAQAPAAKATPAPAAPVTATPATQPTAPASPTQGATTKAGPRTGALAGAVLLPLASSTASHGAAIYAAAQGYPMGPQAAAAAGAPAAYITGACSYLACAALGYNPKAPKKAGAVAVWYNPATGQPCNAQGAAMQPGQPGPHNGATAANTGPQWAAVTAAVLAYHEATGTPAPAWAAPATA